MMGRVALGVALMAAASASAESPSAELIEQMETGLRPDVFFEGDDTWTVSERMEHYGVPGVSVGVIDNFEVVWSTGYGVADRETGEPVGSNTLFQAASISKPVSAFGAMRLVEEGTLDLNAPINDALKSWQVPDSEFSAGDVITLRHLLSHTAGLTVHGFLGYAVGLPVPTVVQVLDGAAPSNGDPVRAFQAPGVGYQYSGGGYTVAQLAMIEASGQAFPALMTEKVLKPIGMKHSTYFQPLPDVMLARAASGVLPNGQAVEGHRHTYPEMAAAGLWTTGEDLAKFGVEVAQAARGKSDLMSQATAETMLTAVDRGYALGFGVNEIGGEPHVMHGGWNEGFSSQFIVSLDKGKGAAVLINGNFPEFAEELIRSIGAAYEWSGSEAYKHLDVPADLAASGVGRYELDLERALTVYQEDGKLFARPSGDPAQELAFIGDGELVARGNGRKFEFTTADGLTTLGMAGRDGQMNALVRLSKEKQLAREVLLDGKFDEAVDAYRELIAAHPEQINEGYLNGAAYAVLRQSNPNDAIMLFRVNTVLYPESSNVWDSLAEAYRAAGETKKSIATYQRALDINPRMETARNAIEEMGGSVAERSD